MGYLDAKVLAPRTSAEGGEIKYVPQQLFPRALNNLLESGKEGAVYTEGVESRMHLYMNGIEHVDFHFSKGFHKANTFQKAIQLERIKLAQILSRDNHEAYRRKVNLLNALERTVFRVAEEFRGHSISTVTVHHTLAGAKEKGVFNFHKDYGDSARKMLTVVVTLKGPSTVYESASAQTFGPETDHVAPPNESMVGHTGHVRHRSPLVDKKTERFAIVIELEPKEKK